MKTILVSLYKLDELSEQAQEKAIQRLWNINVDFEWWEFTYDHFAKLADCFGITVDLKKTWFNGFNHQGQGCSYIADVDVLKLLKCLQSETWKEKYPKEKFRFYEMNVDRRVMKLMESAVIDTCACVKPANRETNVKVEVNADYSCNECLNYDRIEGELEKVVGIVEDVCEELNFYLFKKLQEEFEFLTGEQQVRDSIIANGYDFTEDGKLY